MRTVLIPAFATSILFSYGATAASDSMELSSLNPEQRSEQVTEEDQTIGEDDSVVKFQDENHVAMATYFGGLGFPAGGCGIPPSVVEAASYVALNVQHAQPPMQGEFDQGRNSGRWIEVTLSKFCENADHSDRWNTDSCAGGHWAERPLSGAKANFIVADSCNDGNFWCRLDRYHLDLSVMGLSQFGSQVNPSNWGNPQVTWRYVDAPAYSGDVNIGFAQNASRGWPTILLTHLRRGVHRVEQLVGGRWVTQPMHLTLGQVFILTNVGAEPYRIRLFDAHDEPVENGRIYRFTMPDNCCGRTFNEVKYATE